MRVDPAERRKIPLIHITDLLHPYGDLDDHFDLAACFAFSTYDLKAVILDISSVRKPHVDLPLDKNRNPGYAPVAQLAHLTGRPVPVATSLQGWMKHPEDCCLEAPPAEQQGVRLILRVLEESPVPVVITLVGSCRDFAVAYNRRPELVRSKVATVYLAAGDAGNKTQQIHYTGRTECNVSLDRHAFIRLIKSGLPIVWCPCMDGGLGRDDAGQVTFHNDGGHAGWWEFHFSRLAGLRPEVRNYFLYAISKSERSDFINYLFEARSEAETRPLLTESWILVSTTAIAHGAGYSLGRDGQNGYAFVPETAESRHEILYDFLPVSVTVDDQGLTEWSQTDAGHIRLLTQKDKALYSSAMEEAFYKVLLSL